MIKVGFLQFFPVLGNTEKNITSIKSLIREYTFDILVLPELATTGYNFADKEDIMKIAETPGKGKQSGFFTALAKEKDALIITGFAEKESGDRLYNSQLAFFPDGSLKIYRKIHLFGREKSLFEPGNIPFSVFDFRGANIGMMICFDWYFPESARVLSLQGADIIAHSANLVLPGLGQMGMIIRSIENRVFTITANRYGVEKSKVAEYTFTGESQIVDPSGRVLKKAPASSDIVMIAEIDQTQARDKHITQSNAVFKDRRIEFYKSLCQ